MTSDDDRTPEDDFQKSIRDFIDEATPRRTYGITLTERQAARVRQALIDHDQARARAIVLEALRHRALFDGAHDFGYRWGLPILGALALTIGLIWLWATR